MAEIVQETPSANNLVIDTKGARVLGNGDDSSQIVVKKHEWSTDIALDIGGSLIKIVYFTTEKKENEVKDPHVVEAQDHIHSVNKKEDDMIKGDNKGDDHALNIINKNEDNRCETTKVNVKESDKNQSKENTQEIDDKKGHNRIRSGSINQKKMGRMNFTRVETVHLDECIDFLKGLIKDSASECGEPLEQFKKKLKITATGGGAHKYNDLLSSELGVQVRVEDEMECLVYGLAFFMGIPDEVFWLSDVRVDSDGNKVVEKNSAVRPSPNPPQYAIEFERKPPPEDIQFPCLLVNIGSGVSIIRVDNYGVYERISGTSLGGGTLWGLLSLITNASSFDEMLELADGGDHSNVDMLVGDIYGKDIEKIGLKSDTIASSFAKVFKMDEQQRDLINKQDMAKSLLYAISNNIGQIAYMNAELHGLDRIYFGGCFIRGHLSTINTLSYAIRFWSRGTKRALFLRHEGYLGSVGAWFKDVLESEP